MSESESERTNNGALAARKLIKTEAGIRVSYTTAAVVRRLEGFPLDDVSLARLPMRLMLARLAEIKTRSNRYMLLSCPYAISTARPP